MSGNSNSIQVFEHETLRTDRGENRISPIILKALQSFYGEQGVPYFSLIHNGVRFNEYVGVIQIGTTTIEVLPKADKNEDKAYWQKMLIGMLQSVGAFDIYAPSSANLTLKNNSILDLYFELFLHELQFLVHIGLIKRYRRIESNQTSLKGSLNFPRHISRNVIHKERFFVKYSTYDKNHKLHQILFKALIVLRQINTNSTLNSIIGSLLLDFPEVDDIKINEPLFEKLHFDRKTEPYRKAIEIARLILLNYHPDLSRGRSHVLALMFDMNDLWEKFVYKSILKYKTSDDFVAEQQHRSFWKPEFGSKSSMKPDIVINKDKPGCVILDTKWKNLNKQNPSPEDLRQMFVYMKYFSAVKVALVYPGLETKIRSGLYFEQTTNKLGLEECCVISINVQRDIRKWQQNIALTILAWKNKA